MDPITIRRIEVKKLNPDYNDVQQVITYVIDADPSIVLVGMPEAALPEDTITAVETWATEEGLDLG